jgi:hypothetical protein
MSPTAAEGASWLASAVKGRRRCRFRDRGNIFTASKIVTADQAATTRGTDIRMCDGSDEAGGTGRP